MLNHIEQWHHLAILAHHGEILPIKLRDSYIKFIHELGFFGNEEIWIIEIRRYLNKHHDRIIKRKTGKTYYLFD